MVMLAKASPTDNKSITSSSLSSCAGVASYGVNKIVCYGLSGGVFVTCIAIA